MAKRNPSSTTSHFPCRTLALSAFTLILAAGAAAEARVSYLSSSTSTWSRIVGFRPSLPGRDLNGVGLNGATLDGRTIQSVSYASAQLEGQWLSAVWLEGSRLRGLDGDGRRIEKGGLVGGTFEAALGDGSTLTLLVAGEERHPDKVHKDVYGYEVWYEDAAGWQPLCGTDDLGDPLLAIPLEGQWSYEQGVVGGGAHIDDPDAFTFACEGHVLAKCVTAGYKPWREVKSCQRGQGCHKSSLAPHHQACTRALRADFMGDGISHTADGTVINLYDGIGVRVDVEAWAAEAEWGEDGARCITADHRSSDRQSPIDPALLASGCAEAGEVSTETLLVTETLLP